MNKRIAKKHESQMVECDCCDRKTRDPKLSKKIKRMMKQGFGWFMMCKKCRQEIT